MTEYDVKNYLEKIYKVPVLSVRCELIRGMATTVRIISSSSTVIVLK